MTLTIDPKTIKIMLGISLLILLYTFICSRFLDSDAYILDRLDSIEIEEQNAELIPTNFIEDYEDIYIMQEA